MKSAVAHVSSFLLGLACAPAALAQTLPFDGTWLLDEDPKAPAAAYTVLNIADNTMTWTGPARSAPTCVQAFELKEEKPGTVYIDGRGTRFVAGLKGSIPTFLVQLQGSTCGRAGEQTRIRYPLVYDTMHIEVIGYVAGKPVSSRRFHRKPDPRRRP